MIRLFAVILSFIVFIPMQAQAGYWVECMVHAKVKRNLDTGLYRTEIKGAKVSDGHQEKGSPCIKDFIGKTIKIKIKGTPPEGKTVRLKYEFYNGMGKNSVISEESWSYYPPSIRDVLPW